MSLFEPKIAVVLGGGGARGLAHIGVLKVFEEEGIPVHLLTGTSMGAVVAALKASLPSCAECADRIAEFGESPQFKQDKFKDLQLMSPLHQDDQGFISTVKRFYKLGLFFATTLFTPSYIDSTQFESDIDQVIPDILIEDCRLPLAIIATDIKSGREVVLTKGSLRKAVQASSAIAGVFPPVVWDHMELVDGGFVSKVPVEAALRLGADVVLAVDVSSDLADSDSFNQTGSSISMRAHAILAEHAKNGELRFADIAIRPSVAEFHWADFASYADIIPKGAEAARKAIPEIKRVLGRARWGQPLRALRGSRRTLDFRSKR